MKTTNLQAAIERYNGIKETVAETEQTIVERGTEIGKAAKKGDVAKVASYSRLVASADARLDEYKEWLKEAKFEVDFFTYVDKAPGFETFIELFDEMLKDDMEWYRRLKAMTREERKELNKSSQAIAAMREDYAIELFRKDLLGRFAKLAKAIEAKVGTVHTAEIQRNGNDKFDGSVHGDKGSAYIDTHYAGGWNIQRLHLRTRVTLYTK